MPPQDYFLQIFFVWRMVIETMSGENNFLELDAPVRHSQPFVVAVDGYEGPLDVLLAMARKQKVDLTQISILSLVEQYLDFIKTMKHLHIDLAADYLVMAAWLVFLKSRLLLPREEDDDNGELSGEEMAEQLRLRMQKLSLMQKLARNLMERACLGRDIFAHGHPEGITVQRHTDYTDSLYDLLKAYGQQRVRTNSTPWEIKPPAVLSFDDAVKKLKTTLGYQPAWMTLESLAQGHEGEDISSNSHYASMFYACLSLVNEGYLHVRQQAAFSAIYVKRDGSAS